MKMNKKQVFTLALAVCLIAILSMGSLAWFSDSDSVKNDFYFTDSETSNPDDIFSVDVYEEYDSDNDDIKEEYQTGITYTDILPGDVLPKDAYVKNTGHHDQYIRVTITVSDASVWKQAYGVNGVVDLHQIVNGVDESKLLASNAYEDGDSFVYVLYYRDILKNSDEPIHVFESVNVPSALTVEQAAWMNGNFNIAVKADAVQTEHVGDNVLEAFATVSGDVVIDCYYPNSREELILANDLADKYAPEGMNIKFNMAP